jgi:TolA-binding protein
MNELREQLTQLREEVQSTSEQVDTLERDVAEQRAILDAIAEEQGLDVESIVADANIEDVEDAAAADSSAGNASDGTQTATPEE